MARICMLARLDVDHLPPLRRLADALVADGHEVDVYTARAPKGERGMRIGSRVVELPFRSGFAPGFDKVRRELSWTRAFLSAVSAEDYDLFVAHNLEALPAVSWAARGKPFIYHCHELVEWRDCRPAQRIYFVLERLARRAALVVCPDGLRADRLEARLGQRPLVVHNAMPLTERSDDGSLRAAARQAGYAVRRLVLYQGGLSDTAELRAALDAAQHFPDGWTLVLLGWADASAARLLADAHPRVFVHPPVRHDQLWPLVSSADIGLVLYSNSVLNERLAAPNKLGEYLMAGLAVAYSHCESLDRLLGGHPFARAVETSSGAAFAASLAPWFDDHTLDEARRAARLYATTTYHFEHEARPLLQWIGALTAS